MKKQKLLTDEELKVWLEKVHEEIPSHGYWYIVLDMSDDDVYWSNSWGFWGFKDGHHIYDSGDICSKIRQAGDYAREWKRQEMRKSRR